MGELMTTAWGVRQQSMKQKKFIWNRSYLLNLKGLRLKTKDQQTFVIIQSVNRLILCAFPLLRLHYIDHLGLPNSSLQPFEIVCQELLLYSRLQLGKQPKPKEIIVLIKSILAYKQKDPFLGRLKQFSLRSAFSLLERPNCMAMSVRDNNLYLSKGERITLQSASMDNEHQLPGLNLKGKSRLIRKTQPSQKQSLKSPSNSKKRLFAGSLSSISSKLNFKKRESFSLQKPISHSKVQQIKIQVNQDPFNIQSKTTIFIQKWQHKSAQIQEKFIFPSRTDGLLVQQQLDLILKKIYQEQGFQGCELVELKSGYCSIFQKGEWSRKLQKNRCIHKNLIMALELLINKSQIFISRLFFVDPDSSTVGVWLCFRGIWQPVRISNRLLKYQNELLQATCKSCIWPGLLQKALTKLGDIKRLGVVDLIAILTGGFAIELQNQMKQSIEKAVSKNLTFIKLKDLNNFNSTPFPIRQTRFIHSGLDNYLCAELRLSFLMNQLILTLDSSLVQTLRLSFSCQSKGHISIHNLHEYQYNDRRMNVSVLVYRELQKYCFKKIGKLSSSKRKMSFQSRFKSGDYFIMLSLKGQAQSCQVVVNYFGEESCTLTEVEPLSFEDNRFQGKTMKLLAMEEQRQISSKRDIIVSAFEIYQN